MAARFHPWLLVAAFVSAIGLSESDGHGAGNADSGLPDPSNPAAVARGKLLARTYCVTCHLFPEPDAVDRKTWFDQILPRMKYRLGFSSAELEQSPNIRLLREQRRIPDSPVISEPQWLDLSAYYLAHAPEKPVPKEPFATIAVGVPGFRVVMLPIRAAQPAVTAVKVLTRGGAMFADGASQSVQWVLPSGQLAATLPVSNVVSSFRVFGPQILTAGLGSFLPSDERTANVFWMTNSGPESGRWGASPPVLSDLPRTTDANSGDLNGDGRADLVVSCFGNNVGRLSWWEALAEGGYREHVLFPLPGALRTEIADFNRDGHLDIAALVAQETEAMFLFLGNGKGAFERKTLWQHPPYWGYSYFETADFNGDGRLDFLAANGDNGEFSSPPKRCHGVRLYLAQADGSWKESFFFPMNGAYKAMARDFDRDGNLDIAAISFFADYQNAPRGSFVLLKNEGSARFLPFTFAESALGRWLAMDAGDFDGDGDTDILLGSYVQGPTPVPLLLKQAWDQAQQPLVLLENLAPARK